MAALAAGLVYGESDKHGAFVFVKNRPVIVGLNAFVRKEPPSDVVWGEVAYG